MKKITIILLMLIFVPSICILAQETSAQVEDTEPIEALAVGPKASWDIKIFEMGEIEFKTITKAEFTLTNSGNEPLFITYAKSSCGCTDLQYSEAPILPGRSTKVSATYDGTGDGKFMKTITIVTNADTDRTILQIKGNVVK